MKLISQKKKKKCGKRKKSIFLAVLSWTSGTDMWEDKAPVYMSDGLCICVQEEDYV